MTPIDFLFLGALAATVAADTAESLPDPTRPYQYSQVSAIESLPTSAESQLWRLSGIQVRNGLKRALLNGRLVREGDVVGNATVTAIGTSDITLMVDRRPIVVRLLIAQIKQDVAAIHKPEPVGKK